MPASPRTSFNSSQLIRFLASLDTADVADSRQTFAERLSQWLDWTGAISLSGALSAAPPASPASAAPGAASRAQAAIEEFKRMRTDLAQSITTDTRLANAGSAQGEPGFSGFRRHYLAHQRAMDARIGPLRANVRAALSGLSADLARLAALDAALAETLGARERHLLSSVPVRLERHFERSRKAGGEPPAAYGVHLQSVLLAELEIRLQPIEGMIEAMGYEAAKQATRQP
jgi:hypothetical protein